jgi:hypothetical protein
VSLSREGQRILDELEKAINDAFNNAEVPVTETLEILQCAQSELEKCIKEVCEDMEVST